MQVLLDLLSIALYVLYALGLYTIASRRGIPNAWLAWLPVGNVWILGAIADDYRSRQTGKKHKLRIVMMVLTVAMVVLTVAVVVCSVSMLLNVLTLDEITDFYATAAGVGGDLYAVSEEEMIQQLAERIESRVTDQVADSVINAALVMVVLSVLMLAVAIAQVVIECICTYRLFASCDPQCKWFYLVLGILLNVLQVFVFLCRNKDLGMEPQEPDPVPELPPWQQDPPAWEQN